MNTPLKLAAFGVGLAALFGAATGLGAAVGPVGPAAENSAAGHDMAGGEGAGGSGAHQDGATHDAEAASLPTGLAVSEDGYTLVLDQPELPAGTDVPLTFRMTGPDGEPVTEYEVRNDEDLHVVAVRRDLSGYQHVHPDLAADGTWTVPVTLSPGSWRVFTDFAAADDGEPRTLGADLSVAGDQTPEALPEPALTTEVDGYTVVLDGSLTPGEESPLRFGISRNGVPVTDLQPYLGAYGHLVTLRAGDLGYLHAHPAEPPAGAAPAPGPNLGFEATAPSPGTYRLYLDFRHGDAVHTAEFTVTAGSHEEHGS